MPEVLDPSATPVPCLLVELPSRRQVFFANLRDFLFPGQVPLLDLCSAPAPFWHDVFVERGLPWFGFLKSTGFHIVAFALLIAVARFVALRPHAEPLLSQQVLVYQTEKYLPPLDTRDPEPAPIVKADPELSPQPIISVPSEADNRSQTIVTPPNVKLNRDVPLPNIVAWSDQPTKPQLYIQPAPLTLASEMTRLAPKIEDSVVAPPPDLQSSSTANTLRAPQPSVIAPPPSVESSSRRPGDIDIAPSAVIAPAPQLSVAEQTAFSGARLGGSNMAAQVVPPPPSVSSGSPGFGARGRMIALNLHPAVGAPPAPPAGNRRGTFAATPEGHPGASGSPGSSSGASGSGSGSSARAAGNLPSGLYVGNASPKTAPVAGQPSSASASATNSNRAAGVNSPRRTDPSHPTEAAKSSGLTDAERQVFGDRKVYSLTLNMPNLNSAGGSWVVRFAEMKPDATSSAQDSTSTTSDLSQPQARRKVDPAYPMQLMRENIAGTVILYGVIRKDGTVGNIRVIRGVDPRLDRVSTQALGQWQFQPATKNGDAVDVEATFQIPFRPSLTGF